MFVSDYTYKQKKTHLNKQKTQTHTHTHKKNFIVRHLENYQQLHWLMAAQIAIAQLT